MKKNVDKSNKRSLIITTLIIALTIAMGIIYGPEKKEIKKKDTSVTANSGNERKDIGVIADAEFKYTEKLYEEYLTKYNKWLYNYSKDNGISKWAQSWVKKAPWCYIFVDWCANKAECKLVSNHTGNGFHINTSIDNAINGDGVGEGWYSKKGRLETIKTCKNLVDNGEIGDMVFSVGTGTYAGQNHICFIGSKTKTSVTLHEGDYIDSDGKFKVWKRTVESSDKTIFGT